MKGAVAAVAFVLAVSSTLVSTHAYAHPHGWIDLSVRLITNDEGMLTVADGPLLQLGRL